MTAAGFVAYGFYEIIHARAISIFDAPSSRYALKQLMDPKLIALAIAAVLVIAALAWLGARRRRTTTAELRSRSGSGSG